MQINVYTIYDEAAKAYTTPFFLINDGLAIRAFVDNVNSKDDNNISRHPAQFTLFRIGEFNDQTAELLANNPKSLGNGLEFVEPSRQLVMDYGEKLDEIHNMLLTQ